MRFVVIFLILIIWTNVSLSKTCGYVYKVFKDPYYKVYSSGPLFKSTMEARRVYHNCYAKITCVTRNKSIYSNYCFDSRVRKIKKNERLESISEGELAFAIKVLHSVFISANFPYAFLKLILTLSLV